ncbi:MAG: hypothetical protein QOD77_89 [Thermoplasmata archaeon]|jgi:hypothetical protein|nr:hypothetical protein [Thermoplasmata archaeon]
MECQSCAAPIGWVEKSYGCELDCTFCLECAEAMAFTCPNCSGTLSPQAAQARPPPRKQDA